MGTFFFMFLVDIETVLSVNLEPQNLLNHFSVELLASPYIQWNGRGGKELVARTCTLRFVGLGYLEHQRRRCLWFFVGGACGTLTRAPLGGCLVISRNS